MEKRNYGIDLFRIVSMLFVVIVHAIGHGSVQNHALNQASANLVLLLQTIVYCGVNCFALISGYVGYSSRFKPEKIISLWLQVLFYSVTITIAFKLFESDAVGGKALVSAFFPVMSSRYWYFTAYFCLFFFMPVLNRGVRELNHRQTVYLLAVCFLFFSVLTTIRGNDLFGTSFGYGFLWLAVLYFFGAVTRKNAVHGRARDRLYILVFCLCIALTWGVTILLARPHSAFISSLLEDFRLLRYTSPTILAASISLLALFSNMKISGAGIRRCLAVLSPLTFGVYLIHDHPLAETWIMPWAFQPAWQQSALRCLLITLGLSLIVFAACMLIEWLRSKLFRALRISECSAWIAGKLRSYVNGEIF